MYSRQTTLWFLGILTLLVVVVAFIITRPFLYPLAAAIVLAVVFNPIHQRILLWTKGRPSLAALLSTLTLLFVFGIPIFILISIAANEAVSAAQYLTRKSAAEGGFTLFLTTMTERALRFMGHWVDLSKYDIRGTINSHVQQAGVWVLGSGASIIGGFARLLISTVITLVIVYFMFRDGRDWVHRAVGVIPLSTEQARRLIDNISATIIGNVYGIFAVGLVQGVLTGLALAIVGVQSPLLLGLGAAVASVVPVVGAGIVWGPAGLYLIFTGATWKGLFVLLWGSIVISSADNIVRPWVVSGKVQLHPLVLLFFILGGVEAFGFLGLFLGPVIASVMVVLFGMFREELNRPADNAGHKVAV